MALNNTRVSSTAPTRVFQAAGQTAITVMYFCNHSSGTVTVNVYAVNSDDSTAGSLDNVIFYQLAIEAGDTYIVSAEKLILDNGDEIEVEADVADAVTVTVSSIAI
jgi:hypothetical protein